MVGMPSDFCLRVSGDMLVTMISVIGLDAEWMPARRSALQQ